MTFLRELHSQNPWAPTLIAFMLAPVLAAGFMALFAFINWLQDRSRNEEN